MAHTQLLTPPPPGAAAPPKPAGGIELHYRKGGGREEDPCCATWAKRARTSTEGSKNFSGFSGNSLSTGTKFTIRLQLSSVFGMANPPPVRTR